MPTPLTAYDLVEVRESCSSFRLQLNFFLIMSDYFPTGTDHIPPTWDSNGSLSSSLFGECVTLGCYCFNATNPDEIRIAHCAMGQLFPLQFSTAEVACWGVRPRRTDSGCSVPTFDHCLTDVAHLLVKGPQTLIINPNAASEYRWPGKLLTEINDDRLVKMQPRIAFGLSSRSSGLLVAILNKNNSGQELTAAYLRANVPTKNDFLEPPDLEVSISDVKRARYLDDDSSKREGKED